MNTQAKEIIERTLKFSEYHYFMLSGAFGGTLSEYFMTHYHWDGITLKDCVDLPTQFEAINLPSTITLLELRNNAQFVRSLTTPSMKTISNYPLNILFIYSDTPFEEECRNILVAEKFTKIETAEGELYINNNFIQFYA